MEDAVRPNEQAARDMYARGYQTWSSLCESASKNAHLPRDCLQRLRAGFPNLPNFPNNLDVDNSFTNAAVAKGINTWLPAEEPHHLPPFQDEVLFRVGWNKPTQVLLTTDERRSTAALPDVFGKNSNHIPILLQAWAYVLSARWAELIPGAHISQQGSSRSSGDSKGPPSQETNQIPVTIDVGEVKGDAARWWNAILSVTGGWDATMCNTKGGLLYSPWSTALASERPLLVSAKIKTEASLSNSAPTSSNVACSYLTDYCNFHGIDDDLSLAALAAVLLIPATKYDGRHIELPIPELPCKKEITPAVSRFTVEGHLQLDRLLTLSCNARGTKALLTSVFFEPEVATNICGMWLQGSFAFLGKIKDPHSLLRILTTRDPEIGFLWVGAFITGGYHKSLREGRAGWWTIDLGAAAWTGTLMSFIQAPVPRFSPKTESISRADECRLLFLCHDLNYTTPPLFPFAPFGSTALTDTNLDVREHSLCGRDHGLRYSHLTWRCRDGTEIDQGPDIPVIAARPKNGQLSSHGSAIEVDYDGYDSEDENSEMITRNVFTWLRGEDGFPVAERAIREHEWIDNLEDDDDSPIEGDIKLHLKKACLFSEAIEVWRIRFGCGV
ncbi:immunoglobulin variable region used by the ITC63B heavy chain [Fusarium albosuccineum]|uniref:Immunoglobulin variable region used by the ITC63B heavy chain n=1 Tax=Fusarium albosuccineum TaxID=1237068 RepID=A0A8H4P5N2_9HYPO|nr:immunoglobulin variable region used by the ITC63B heavy chain [Fusarium albosuccineum]